MFDGQLRHPSQWPCGLPPQPDELGPQAGVGGLSVADHSLLPIERASEETHIQKKPHLCKNASNVGVVGMAEGEKGHFIVFQNNWVFFCS